MHSIFYFIFTNVHSKKFLPILKIILFLAPQDCYFSIVKFVGFIDGVKSFLVSLMFYTIFYVHFCYSDSGDENPWFLEANSPLMILGKNLYNYTKNKYWFFYSSHYQLRYNLILWFIIYSKYLSYHHPQYSPHPFKVLC